MCKTHTRNHSKERFMCITSAERRSSFARTIYPVATASKTSTCSSLAKQKKERKKIRRQSMNAEREQSAMPPHKNIIMKSCVLDTMIQSHDTRVFFNFLLICGTFAICARWLIILCATHTDSQVLTRRESSKFGLNRAQNFSSFVHAKSAI